MKFGKRLSAEAEHSRWEKCYLNYKALKHAIYADVAAKDVNGTSFDRILKQELSKVGTFFSAREDELDVALQAALRDNNVANVSTIRSELQDLRKFITLNYIAVVKAVKKRNRQLGAACAHLNMTSLKAVNILAGEHFFTSLRLAALTTRAEIAVRESVTTSGRQGEERKNEEDVVADFTCPICLSLLHNPVVLSCAHRFCWGCLVAHCSAVKNSQEHQAGEDHQQNEEARLMHDGQHYFSSSSLKKLSNIEDDDDDDDDTHERSSSTPASPTAVVVGVNQPAVWESDASDDENATVATFGCPCCRKAQLLDLDRLQVDPHLSAFVQRLDARYNSAATKKMSTTTTTTTTVVQSESSAGEKKVETFLHLKLRRDEEAGEDGDDVEMVDAKNSISVTAAAAEKSTTAATSTPIAIKEKRDSADGDNSSDMLIDDSPSAPKSALLSEIEDEAATDVSSSRRSSHLPPSPYCLPSATPPTTLTPREEPSTQPRSLLPPSLLPPQRPEHRGRLTVCLDLDGTLVTTFTPKRAPSLPPSMTAYIVGRGGTLNPSGIFVVERPGLGEFLQHLAAFAEVVIFTAGLEDYASPICDEIEKRYGPVVHRLYRPATVHSHVYPCVKDLSRLGRDLHRCVLLDDTPLAFFFQPDHGIPVLPFKGDADDRILTEAVGPLLEYLAAEKDIPRQLARRFNMQRWFASQGLKREMAVPTTTTTTATTTTAAGLVQKVHAMNRTPSAPLAAASAKQHSEPLVHQRHQHHHQQQPHNAPAAQILNTRATSAMSSLLLVCDFDKTLVDFDSGERLCDELTPELTSLLSQVQTPANFIPLTNTVLAEMQRRGVSRDKIVAALHGMATEVPIGTTRLLRWASQRGLDVKILSDANSVVIAHMLTAAKLHSCVSEVITNPAGFQRIQIETSLPTEDEDGDDATFVSTSTATATTTSSTANGAPQSGWFFNRRNSSSNATTTTTTSASKKAVQAVQSHYPPQYRLVIEPRYDESVHGVHGCPLCPSNLCKGRELRQLRCVAVNAGGGSKVIYVGDGANDLCAALSLGVDDVVLARAGHPLQHMIAELSSSSTTSAGRKVLAQVRIWSSHDELAKLVEEVAVE